MKYEPNKITVSVRTGEPLEDELRNRGVTENEQAELNKAIKNFTGRIETTPEIRHAYEYVEESLLKYNIAYGETAYCLGYSDGVENGMQRGADGKSTILSIKDMSYLVNAYDAIRKMSTTLLGKFELHTKEEGVMGALDCILDVIEHGVSKEYSCLEDDELTIVVDILNDDASTPEERAKRLLNYKN